MQPTTKKPLSKPRQCGRQTLIFRHASSASEVDRCGSKAGMHSTIGLQPTCSHQAPSPVGTHDIASRRPGGCVTYAGQRRRFALLVAEPGTRAHHRTPLSAVRHLPHFLGLRVEELALVTCVQDVNLEEFSNSHLRPSKYEENKVCSVL